MKAELVELKRSSDFTNIVNENILAVIDDERYKYYFTGNYIDLLEAPKEIGWSKDGFFIYYNGLVAGHIHIGITLSSETINNIGIMTYPNFLHKGIGPIAMQKLLDYLLIKRNFRRVEFFSITENPAKKLYDQIVDLIGGRITGTETEAAKLLDNKYYDITSYEILRKNYKGFEK